MPVGPFALLGAPAGAPKTAAPLPPMPAPSSPSLEEIAADISRANAPIPPTPVNASLQFNSLRPPYPGSVPDASASAAEPPPAPPQAARPYEQTAASSFAANSSSPGVPAAALFELQAATAEAPLPAVPPQLPQQQVVQLLLDMMLVGGLLVPWEAQQTSVLLEGMQQLLEGYTVTIAVLSHAQVGSIPSAALSFLQVSLIFRLPALTAGLLIHYYACPCNPASTKVCSCPYCPWFQYLPEYPA